MTVEELLRSGGEREAAGDLEGAEAAYREADELDDAEGAILVGLLLKRRGELREAAAAFQRSAARGHPEAGSCLGNLLSENGDFEGAKAAYEQSIAVGSTDAVLNLGLMLAEQGALDEALPHLRAAEETGDAGASWAIGKLQMPSSKVSIKLTRSCRIHRTRATSTGLPHRRSQTSARALGVPRRSRPQRLSAGSAAGMSKFSPTPASLVALPADRQPLRPTHSVRVCDHCQRGLRGPALPAVCRLQHEPIRP